MNLIATLEKEEAARVLGEAIDYARQGQLAAATLNPAQ